MTERMDRLGVAAAAGAFILAGCGGSSSGSAAAPARSTGSAATLHMSAIEQSVRAYSAAYLTGHVGQAWDMVSTRCQNSINKADFTGAARAAGSLYGNVPMTSFTVDSEAAPTARVSYTFAVSKLNQHGQPWRLEEGQWVYDDC